MFAEREGGDNRRAGNSNAVSAARATENSCGQEAIYRAEIIIITRQESTFRQYSSIKRLFFASFRSSCSGHSAWPRLWSVMLYARGCGTWRRKRERESTCVCVDTTCVRCPVSCGDRRQGDNYRLDSRVQFASRVSHFPAQPDNGRLVAFTVYTCDAFATPRRCLVVSTSISRTFTFLRSRYNVSFFFLFFFISTIVRSTLKIFGKEKATKQVSTRLRIIIL